MLRSDGSICQQNQIVAVNGFIAVGIAQATFDLARLAADELAQILAAVGDQPAGEFVALGVSHEDGVAAHEVAFDAGDSGRQEAAPLLDDGIHGPFVQQQHPGRLGTRQYPRLSALAPALGGGEAGSYGLVARQLIALCEHGEHGMMGEVRVE